MSGLYKCRILVVEDDKSISDIIRKNLRMLDMAAYVFTMDRRQRIFWKK